MKHPMHPQSLLGPAGSLILSVVLVGCGAAGSSKAHRVPPGVTSEPLELASSETAPEDAPSKVMSNNDWDLTPWGQDRVASAAEELTDMQRRVLLQHGTERPGTSELLGNKHEGLYVCRICKLPLYASDAKFESGSGWPSFFEPFKDSHVEIETDLSHGMIRSEVHCPRCKGHLGHVFSDGPRPTGMRHCINGASIEFVDSSDPLPDPGAESGE